MSEFKAGDKAILTIEVEVVNGLDDDGDVTVVHSVGYTTYVKPEHLTKIKPALPTKVGAVIRVADSGNTYVLSAYGWHGAAGALPAKELVKWDYEVLSEGIDA